MPLSNWCIVSKFHIRAATAYKVINELGFRPDRFTLPPTPESNSLYGVNFKLRTVFYMTRSDKPRRNLSFEEIRELSILPIEAHDVWIENL